VDLVGRVARLGAQLGGGTRYIINLSNIGSTNS